MVLAVGINFGYICVSTNEQNSDRQLEVIKPYITDEKYMYSDKASGKNMERGGFQNMLNERWRYTVH